MTGAGNRDPGSSARPTARVEHGDLVVPSQTNAESVKGAESRDDSALSGTRSEGRGRRTSRRRLSDVARSLTDRDRAVLRSLSSFGLLRTTHLQQLHFYDHATPEAAARVCRSVTKRLSDHRLIEPIERRIGGVRAGSSGTVWRLGPSGERVLREANPDAPRSRRREPSLRFLEHRMLVADVACTLTTAAHFGELELLNVHPEPASWRTYSGSSGAREVLKPDLFAVTAAGDYEDHWFIEIDRGTESLPTLLKQCSQYERYRRSGREQRLSGIFPRVLWLVPDYHRRGRLTEALQRERSLDVGLYRVELIDSLLAAVTGGAL